MSAPPFHPPARRLQAAALGLLLALCPAAAHAQSTEPHDEGEEAARINPYGTGLGGQVLLTNSGFGLGGYYQKALSPSVSLLTELSLGAGKDEREVAFFDRFGRRDIPNKANYLLMLNFNMGLQKYLFQESIEENFRPYFQFSFGPTFGWEYPYFEDCDGDQAYSPIADCDGDGESDGERTFDSLGSIRRGHMNFGLGGTIAIGAFFGLSTSVSQGVRFGYTFTYFTEGVQLLEPAVQGAQNFFGSPSITIIFGKLF
jgi:hypothetical protein